MRDSEQTGPAVARVQAWLAEERQAGRLIFGLDDAWVRQLLDVASPPDTAAWQAPDTAPTDGQSFLAELSNGWVVILYATEAVRRRHRYAWWGAHSLSIPYEPTHPADTDWTASSTLRLTGWMLLPKSRKQMVWDAEDVARASGQSPE